MPIEIVEGCILISLRRGHDSVENRTAPECRFLLSPSCRSRGRCTRLTLSVTWHTCDCSHIFLSMHLLDLQRLLLLRLLARYNAQCALKRIHQNVIVLQNLITALYINMHEGNLVRYINLLLFFSHGHRTSQSNLSKVTPVVDTCIKLWRITRSDLWKRCLIHWSPYWIVYS